MEKTRVIVVKYDQKISLSEIPLFRGAVINAMGGEADILYHNHNGDALVYHYPLIQYKRIGQCASIVAVDSGVDVIGQFLSSGVTKLKLGAREDLFSVVSVKATTCLVQVWNGEFKYMLRKWLPLNSQNFAAYIKIVNLSDRIAFLERILAANILSFAKGVGITVSLEIIVKVTSINKQQLLTYKGVKMMSFDIEFVSNVTVPDFVGLGKGVSLGFGMICRNYRDE